MKPSIIFLYFFISTICYSQTSTVDLDIPTATPLRFYKNYEDFIANIHIDGYEVIRKENKQSKKAGTHYGVFKVRELAKYKRLQFDKLEVKIENSIKKLSSKEYPSSFVTNEYGVLVRLFEGYPYYVLFEGVYCHYIDVNQCIILKDDSGALKIEEYSGSDHFSASYFSLKIDGDIKKLKEKSFKEILSNYDLVFEYEKEKKKVEAFYVETVGKAHFYRKMIKLLNLKISDSSKGNK